MKYKTEEEGAVDLKSMGKCFKFEVAKYSKKDERADLLF